MENAINLCDVLPSNEAAQKYIDQILSQSFTYDRVYIGSYFCSNKFFSLKSASTISLMDALFSKSIPVSLVVPIFAQHHLASGSELIQKMVNNYYGIINEIVVNDLGMLQHVYDIYKSKSNRIKIVAGRMLNKTYRDIRDEEYFSSEYIPKCLNEYYISLYEHYGIQTIELDNSFNSLTLPERFDKYCFAVHMPLCYVTKCNICEFASITKSISKKFRTTDACSYECMGRYIQYLNGKDNTVIHYKIGCGVYFENKSINIKTAKIRTVYNPYLDEVQNENFSSIK